MVLRTLFPIRNSWSNAMRKILSLLLVMQLAVLCVSARLYVITQGQFVRRGPGTKFDTYYKLNRGDTVELMEVQGKWTKVIYLEKEGFVPSKTLKEIHEDDSLPVEKPDPQDERDPYEDLDITTVIGILLAIGALWGLRVLIQSLMKKRKAAVEAATPVIPPKPSYWFVCKNCNQKIRSASRPSSAYCLKAPDHDWINLGLAGDNYYHCNHCGIMVMTAKAPNIKDCSAGEAHNWTDLGPNGTKHYYCKACGITVMTTKEPTNVNCSHAEVHTWAEL